MSDADEIKNSLVGEEVEIEEEQEENSILVKVKDNWIIIVCALLFLLWVAREWNHGSRLDRLEQNQIILIDAVNAE